LLAFVLVTVAHKGCCDVEDAAVGAVAVGSRQVFEVNLDMVDLVRDFAVTDCEEKDTGQRL
jgi:hypothetical protein